MDITPFRAGTIVGITKDERTFKIKRMDIHEEQLNETLYPGQYEFKISLLLAIYSKSEYPKWHLPQISRMFYPFRIASNLFEVFQTQYNIDNSIEVQLRTFGKS